MLILIFILSLFTPSLTFKAILISLSDGIKILGLTIELLENETSSDDQLKIKSAPSGSDDKEASSMIVEPSKACHDGDQ